MPTRCVGGDTMLLFVFFTSDPPQSRVPFLFIYLFLFWVEGVPSFIGDGLLTFLPPPPPPPRTHKHLLFRFQAGSYDGGKGVCVGGCRGYDIHSLYSHAARAGTSTHHDKDTYAINRLFKAFDHQTFV